jgi:type I restriction enzyme S subunit
MMNNELRPYELRPVTDIPWIESIPAHWDVQRGKAVYKKLNRPTRSNDEVVTCFRDGVVTLRKNRRTTGFTESIKEIGYQGIRKGDLVIHVMDAFAGAIGVSDSDGKGTPVYSVCESKVDLNNYYYAYVIREMAKTGFIQSLYRGIRERSSDFRFEVFANQYLPIPPLSEQDQIVKYLDHQLAKINKFIKAKKKLIAVLKEQKQAIINEAVTKGLDPDIKMNPSGIDWLGDVPEHWEVTNLSRAAKVILSGLDKKSYPNQRKVSLCNYVDVYKNDFIDRSINFMQATASEEEIKNLTLREGDIVITKDSESWKDIAVPAIVSDELYNVLCAYHLAIIRVDTKKVNSNFIFCSLLSEYLSTQFKLRAKGVTRYGLSYQAVKDAKVALPPLKEQIEISNHILACFKSIDNAIKVLQKEIELISEYKKSLITDVVTGKVDVRTIVFDKSEDEAIEVMELDEESVDEEILEVEDGDE